MKKGSNFKRKNLPTMQQLNYLMELYQLNDKKGAVMKVAKICGVDHGAVSRYFKQCRERDYITDAYEFTELGKAKIHGYNKIIAGLREFFLNMDLTEEQIEESIKNQIENVEYDVLVYMVQNMQRNKEENNAEREQSIHNNRTIELFAKGRTPVWFAVFHLIEGDKTAISMADRGFEKPACLCVEEKGAWLELKICEMNARSRVDGHPMSGHLESLKYASGGFLHQAVINEHGIVRIPLEVFNFRRYKNGEMKGILQITATCNVGRTHMPESAAMLVFWL